MRLNKLQVFLIILISLLVGYGVGLTKVSFEWKHFKPQVQIVNKEPPLGATIVDLGQFWAVWDKVSTMYYDKKVVDPQKMLNGAIEGMVSSLGDPFTMYLPPAQQTNFQQQMAGQFTGIGAELGTKDKQIIVIAPLDGSPAQKAGIRAGDIILKVDNTAIYNLNIQEVVNKIRGPKGTPVALAILHPGDKEVKNITITRDVITVKSVAGWVKDVKDVDAVSDDTKKKYAGQQVMYVRLSQFGDATNQDWTAIIEKLRQDNPHAKGMVFDLRNNPGGYLTDAVFIAGEFLPENTQVVTEDMGNGDKTTLSVNRKGQLLDIPLVVIVNGGSASASEIVSGSLRDNGRAKLVGDISFGKGTVQQALDMGNGAGLHVTIARWLTPKGIWVSDPQKRGLVPDVKVSLDPNDPAHDTQLEAAIKEVLK